MFGQKYIKIKRNIEDYGLYATTKKAVGHLVSPLYISRLYTVYAIDLSTTAVPKTENNHFAFRLLTLKDKHYIREIEAMEEWLNGRLEQRLRSGGLCLAALDGECLVGFNLIVFGKVEIPLIMKEKVFGPHEAWSEQITVKKEYRKQGVASALRYQIFTELKHRGIQEFYGGALRSNRASLKLAEKVGFREVADVHFIKILGRKTWRSTGRW
jgi:GNAT superfamily N-acetyltransferase